MPDDKKVDVTDFDTARKEASNQLDLKTVSQQFNGDIIESYIGNDRQNNKCLFISICLNGERKNGKPVGVIKQKFTSTIIDDFVNSLKSIGFKTIPVGSESEAGPMIKWENQKKGRSVFARWFPIEAVSGQQTAARKR